MSGDFLGFFDHGLHQHETSTPTPAGATSGQRWEGRGWPHRSVASLGDPPPPPTGAALEAISGHRFSSCHVLDLFLKSAKFPRTCSRAGRALPGDGAWDSVSSLSLPLPTRQPLFLPLREGQMQWERKLVLEVPPSTGCSPAGERSLSTLTNSHDQRQQQEGLHVGRVTYRPSQVLPASAPAPAVLLTFNDPDEDVFKRSLRHAPQLQAGPA